MDDGFKRPDEMAQKETEDVQKDSGAGMSEGKDSLQEVVRMQTGASENGLPFSKARTVALVATVAAAPFLSVSRRPGGTVR